MAQHKTQRTWAAGRLAEEASTFDGIVAVPSPHLRPLPSSAGQARPLQSILPPGTPGEPLSRTGTRGAERLGGRGRTALASTSLARAASSRGDGGAGAAAASAPATPRSAVVAHEMQILESVMAAEGPGLTPEHVDRCFAMLDELIPKLGLYRRAVKLLRDELFDAVHSEEFTIGSDGRLHRLPFFAVFDRLQGEVAERSDQLRSKLRQTREERSRFRASISNNESEVAAMRAHLAGLEEQLAEQRTHADRERQRLLDLQAAQRQKDEEAGLQREQLLAKIRRLEAEIKVQRDEMTGLKKYQQTFDALDAAFEHPPASNGPRRTVANSQRATLQLSLQQAQGLEAELLEIRHHAFNEYDAFLAECDALSGNNSMPPTHVRRQQERFLSSVQKVEAELALNREYQATLRQQMHDLQNRNLTEYEAKHKFSAQEGILNKFSVTVLFSSDDGESFVPEPSADYCASCNGRTTVCVHKARRAGQVLRIPANATHVKLGAIVREGVAEDDMAGAASAAGVKAKLEWATPLTKYRHLWKGFGRDKAELIGKPRALEAAEVRSVLECFVDAVIWKDQFAEGHTPTAIRDFFMSFLEERYLSVTMAQMAAADIFHALQRHSSADPYLDFYAQILSGTIEVSCARTLRLIRDKILTIGPWERGLEAFRSMCVALYPWMKPEAVDVQVLHMESWCGEAADAGLQARNALSINIIERYMLHLILHKEEPLLKRIRFIADHMHLENPTQLSISEFAELVSDINNSIDDKLAIRLYLDADANSGPRVPKLLCCHIAAFGDLQARVNDVQAAFQEILACTPDWKREANQRLRDIAQSERQRILEKERVKLWVQATDKAAALEDEMALASA